MIENWQALWLLPLFPLLGSLVCAVAHFRLLRARRNANDEGLQAHWTGLVACSALGASLLVALMAFGKLLGLASEGVFALESAAWSWIDAGSFEVELSMVVDRLSSVMILVITGVGLLIHVYSLGYMKEDPGCAKFFAYLNLFVFAMLILVLSSSLLGLFVGWEGVGLCSYLLIGFWYDKGWPAEAGQKAFVVNRIGDACFLVGSFLLIGVFGTLDLSDIAGLVPAMLDQKGTLGLAALCLFAGACGKSAQWPLFTWLPDAMAGPTPVSALIHAATMVTAGVYLIVRLNPLFAASTAVLALIGVVGALTAFIGASSALAQRDIKKVLAYSTVSQLGYMFLGLASGAWAAAVFHLVTHAFFKGLLFLGSGSVIHGMHEEQDMYKMGGLRAHMPRTCATFVAGAAALSGLPLLSGFFSKDEILAHTFGHGGLYAGLWLMGLAAAAMTAFYTWRMVALTFFGDERFDVQAVHPHESPASMTLPLVLLALLAVFGGLLNLPHVLPGAQVLMHWLEPVTAPGNRILWAGRGGEPPHLSVPIEWALLGLGSLVALVFAHLGFHGYKHGYGLDEHYRDRRPGLWDFLEKAWRIDSSYTDLVVLPIKLIAFLVATVVDQFAIDGAVNASATLTRAVAGRLRAWVDGSVKNYALWMGAGAAGLTLIWMWSRA